MDNYQLLSDWPRLADGSQLGNPTGLGIDSHQHIFIFHRAGSVWTSIDATPQIHILSPTILMLDRDTGKILSSWGEDLFVMPHGLTVDRDDNIWVTDVGSHQVFKFSHEGELLMQLSSHFYAPTDVAVAEDGSFYVSDGYGNSRVVKFSPTGEYLFEWGRKGDQAGEFNLPHAIELDGEGKVYIADRENSRIQVFTPKGAFLTQWRHKDFGKISSVVSCPGGFFATDYSTSPADIVLGSTILLLDSSGNLITKFAQAEGMDRWYHNIAIDDQQNIYVTDILRNSIQKFAPAK